MTCCVVFLSLTQTQCGADALRAAGVGVSTVRPPLSLGRGSCSYALLIRRDRLPQALAALSRAGLRPMVYESRGDGSFREVGR